MRTRPIPLLLPRRWLGSSTRGRRVLLHHMPETQVGAHDIWEWRQGRGGELPNAVGPNGVLQGPDETDRSPGTQHPIPSCAESYLIRDALGYPDLALKGKITFGVSAAQENKIDVDRTHAA
jgi:hypothetical protein